jgi:HSP20 family protein
MNPFALLGRLTEEMTNVFNDAGAGRGNTQGMAAAFAPDIDVVQRGNELVVRADLPGLSADDVMVEIGEDAITISGVRRQEHEEERGGVYRFERQFGAFSRVVPLPTGAITDQARAVFKDGVLEIHVPAPPEQVARGRRLEVSQGDDSKKQGGDSRK